MKEQNTQPKYPAFEAWLKANDVQFATEYEFAEALGRKWRTDYYFEKGAVKLAVEVEGGMFYMKREDGTMRRGAHGSIKDGLKDIEKYNFYTFLGIKLLRLQPSHVQNSPVLAVDAIKSILDGSNDIDKLKALFPAKVKKKLDLEVWLLENGWRENTTKKVPKGNKLFEKMYNRVLLTCRINSRYLSTYNDLGAAIDEKRVLPKTKKAATEIFSPKRLMQNG